MIAQFAGQCRAICAIPKSRRRELRVSVFRVFAVNPRKISKESAVAPCRLVHFAIAFILIVSPFLAVRVQAQTGICDANYIKNLPAPILGPNHRVIQLVNCTNQVLPGAANSAHRIKQPGYPVFPREKTWVMQPFNPSNPADHSNILTIDIPQQWENTVGTKKQGANAPNIWARTGCRYEVATNRAVCETGGCNDAYDCSSAGYGASPFTTFTEWTFYQPTSNPKVFLDNPDVSAVNGASLTVDIQPIGGDSMNPFGLDYATTGRFSGAGDPTNGLTEFGCPVLARFWLGRGFSLVA
jgi:Thaumatin family